jgi:hypothetical protein
MEKSAIARNTEESAKRQGRRASVASFAERSVISTSIQTAMSELKRLMIWLLVTKSVRARLTASPPPISTFHVEGKRVGSLVEIKRSVSVCDSLSNMVKRVESGSSGSSMKLSRDELYNSRYWAIR